MRPITTDYRPVVSHRPLRLAAASLLLLAALAVPAQAQPETPASPTLPALPFVPQEGSSTSGAILAPIAAPTASANVVVSADEAEAAALPVFPLQPGAVEGNINDRFPSVRYSYSAATGESVRLRMESTSGDLDPVLTLLQPDGSVIARNDDEATGSRSAALGLTLPAAGVYTVEASRYLPDGGIASGSSGTFRLTLDVAGAAANPNDDPLASAPPFAVPYTILPLQTVASGAISVDQPRTYYAVAGQPGDLLRVIMTSTSGDLAPALRILDERSQPISRDQQSRAGESIVYAPLIRAGWTLVEASAVTGAGGYDLYASRLAAAPIRIGEPVSGTLDRATPTTIYLLNGRLGEQISATAFANDAEGGLQPHLTLLDVGQREIASASGDRFATLRAELPRSGPYLLQISSGGPADSGGYSLRLASRPPDIAALAAAPISYNNDSEGVLAADQPFTLYRFSGKAGDLMTVALQARDSAFNPYLILMDADLNELASNDDSGASRDARIAQFRLPKDGDFLIAAARAGSDPGSADAPYRLSLTAGAVTLEQGPVTATLRWQGPADLSLYLRGPDGRIVSPSLPRSPEGGALQIDSNANCGTPSAEPVEHIYWTTAAPLAGDYTIWAWNEAGCGVDTPVPFTLELDVEGAPVLSAAEQVLPGQRYEATVRVGLDGEAGISEPGVVTAPLPQQQASEGGDIPLRYGDALTGTLGSDRFALFYRFSGASGDVVTLRAERLTGDLDPLIVLRDSTDHTLPGGVNDDASSGTRDAELTYTLPADGEYIVSVTRYGVRDGLTTGDFRLTLQGEPGS
ncbi:MAG TPA: PPC domain-containing protein [Candidatus Limnocylindrales bacterium]|nr:PPC domain-containing protein [Candidatus Limnocylindrales bacterium]